MSRARATALALVNWKGVFYERYLLDHHVTALEGANGAGKTTVMIAAYVVLLPDLARLRFTNLGETGATGGDRGIWGRLGDLSRPSYAALQIETADQKLLFGVVLERKTEPSLQLTPFCISDYGEASRIQDLLLCRVDDQDAVPTLQELKQNVTAAGAKLTVFASLKDYFAKWFELGIGPMRLSSDEERNKWNEMLRTSMTGGISRALTSELRSFVLKQETGLSDTLTRMRSNLTACRKTRTEVSEARVLEHEISGVYDAGQAFFACVVLAVRERAQEAANLWRKSTQQVDALRVQVAELDGICREYESRRSTLASRISAADAARVTTAERLRKLQRVKQMQERSAGLLPELSRLGEEAALAQQAQAQAQAQRSAAVEQRNRAQLEVKASAEGLAHVQTGLSELHKRAFLHQRALEQRASLRAKLRIEPSEPAARAAAETQLAQEITELDAELARRERSVTQLGLRRSQYLEAMRALQQLDGAASNGLPFERAKTALQRLARLQATALRAEELAERQRIAADAGVRQVGLLRQLVSLSGTSEEPPTSRSFLDWLHGLEASCRLLEEQARKLETQLAETVQAISECERESRRLFQRQGVYEKAAQLADKLQVLTGQLAPTREALREAKLSLYTRRSDVERREAQISASRERLLAEVTELESGATLTEPGVGPLCDDLQGELLLRRFDDLEAEAARQQEARLGALVSAVVVEDPVLAAHALQKLNLGLKELHLVRSAIDPCGTLSEVAVPGYVVVEEAYGLRLTKLPEAPLLGHAARQRALAERNTAFEDAGVQLEDLAVERQRLSSALSELDELESLAGDWVLGDPEAAVLVNRTTLSELTEAHGRLRAGVELAAVALGSERAKLASARGLLPELHWIDQPNQLELSSALGDELLAARSAEAELLRCASAQKLLSETHFVLAEAAPSDEELKSWAEERAGLELRRDNAFKLKAELTAFASQALALEWHDAQRILAERVELAPELEAVHQTALEHADASEQQLLNAEKAWEAATERRQQAQARHEAALAHASRIQAEIDTEGEPDAGPQVLIAAQHADKLAAKQVAELGHEGASIAAEAGRAEERAAQARRTCETEQQRERELAARARPSEQEFERLTKEVAQAGLLQAVFGEAVQSEYAAWTSDALLSEARGKFALLCDRLDVARAGGSLADSLRPEVKEGLSGEVALSVWKAVRAWLSQRVPARIADAGDPLDALQRLRDDLRRLEGRLSNQESDLRGNSEDVARNIDLQSRKAGNQVRRLNQYLGPIQFGSVAGIRIHVGRVERMDQVLHALRAGAAQALLFQSNLPIEEALDEIFRRYGGGKGGGFRLLDYREYIELTVEIQRQRDASWETVNPSRLSTGEAIGVGAALMMVVLTEWERDANLLRAERTTGTLRFLFLDEANRLSRDNLGTLFELCQTLDLQLLIAAPEVAHVDGNTTYRLVRRITEDGREEVLTSGRRAALPD